MTETKPFTISKQLVYQERLRVKANKGSAGDQSVTDFEANLGRNLYKLWNRMSSGSYLPPPVMRVEIQKKDRGTRPPGSSLKDDSGRSRSPNGGENDR